MLARTLDKCTTPAGGARPENVTESTPGGDWVKDATKAQKQCRHETGHRVEPLRLVVAEICNCRDTVRDVRLMSFMVDMGAICRAKYWSEAPSQRGKRAKTQDWSFRLRFLLVDVRVCSGVCEEVLDWKGSRMERFSDGKVLGWKGSVLRQYGRLF